MDMIGITTQPRRPGRDIGPDEKYRKGVWVKAILERGDDTQSDGPPRYHDVFIPGSSSLLREEPFDESEETFDENCAEADEGSSTQRKIKIVSDSTTALYYSERDRLKTFGPWKQSYHVTPLDLTKNGFIYRGPEDRVKCVFCRKIIYKWEEGDVVEEEHRRISPKCPFVNGERDHLNRPIKSADRLLGEDFRVSLKVNSTECAHPSFQDVQLRKETFVNWHHISDFSPEALSEAGFFYTGKADDVTCHQCGVSVNQWKTGDDPWTRHGHHNVRCDFLLHRSTSNVNHDA